MQDKEILNHLVEVERNTSRRVFIEPERVPGVEFSSREMVKLQAAECRTHALIPAFRLLFSRETSM